jgi:hypothetical protein
MTRIAFEKRVVGIGEHPNRKRQRVIGGPEFSVKRNASQVARTPGAVRGKSFLRLRIKLAGAGVPLNGGVELLRVEDLEPGARPRELARGELFNGFLDVFGGRHVEDIAFSRMRRRDRGRNSGAYCALLSTARIMLR